jgi:hypothetical protein
MKTSKREMATMRERVIDAAGKVAGHYTAPGDGGPLTLRHGEEALKKDVLALWWALQVLHDARRGNRGEEPFEKAPYDGFPS